MNKVKELKREILDKLSVVCKSKRCFEYAQDYLAAAKTWKYMLDFRSSYSAKDAKNYLIQYKNSRDRLMPYSKEAVEIVDSYFPIELAPVQAHTDTGLQRLAGAQIEDLKGKEKLN